VEANLWGDEGKVLLREEVVTAVRGRTAASVLFVCCQGRGAAAAWLALGLRRRESFGFFFF
jgi:hypothetical protein